MDTKKAIFLALLAGPKASLIMGPIMLKKFLAHYGIVLTKQMMAMFAVNVAFSFGIWMLYKR